MKRLIEKLRAWAIPRVCRRFGHRTPFDWTVVPDTRHHYAEGSHGHGQLAPCTRGCRVYEQVDISAKCLRCGESVRASVHEKVNGEGIIVTPGGRW